MNPSRKILPVNLHTSSKQACTEKLPNNPPAHVELEDNADVLNLLCLNKYYSEFERGIGFFVTIGLTCRSLLVLQERLFRVVGLPMVENCMAGYNSCMFAYGQVSRNLTFLFRFSIIPDENLLCHAV